MSDGFWKALDTLVATSEIVIDRPKGSAHPDYPDSVYKVDYGYLKGTYSSDGGGIDLYRGSDLKRDFDAVVCTVNLKKRDSEIKLVIGCTPEEKSQIYDDRWLAKYIVERKPKLSVILNKLLHDKFWHTLGELVATSKIVIDRPKGSAHPRYPEFIYPLDYGYLKGTSAPDGNGIDVWRGSDPKGKLDAVVCTVDLVKRDSELKLLIGCTEDEKTVVEHWANGSEFMKGVMIRR